MTTFAELISQFIATIKLWVTVNPWEQGIRVTLGKESKLLQPGWWWKLPGVHKVFIQTTRRRFSAVPTQDFTLADGRTITVSGSLGYTIGDIERLYATLDHAEATLEAEVQDIVGQYILSAEIPSLQGLRAYVDSNLDFAKYGIEDPEFIITTFVSARTYRLLQGEPRDYTLGDMLNTRYTADKVDRS